MRTYMIVVCIIASSSMNLQIANADDTSTNPPMSGHWDQTTVPVYINYGSVTMDTNEILSITKNALNEWYSQSHADLRFYYAGSTSATDPIDGAVLMVWNHETGNCSASCPGAWTSCAKDANGVIEWCHITLNYKVCDNPACTATPPSATDWNIELGGVNGGSSEGYDVWAIVAHEMAHAHGLEHLTGCPGCSCACQSVACACVNNDDHRYLWKSDVLALRNNTTHKYPVRTSVLKRYKSTNGYSWTGLTNLGNFIQGPDIASGDYSGTDYFYYTAVAPGAPGRLDFWRCNSSVCYKYRVASASSYVAAGIAYDDSSNVLLVVAPSVNEFTGCRRKVRYWYSTNNGTSWTYGGFIPDVCTTAKPGVAYDPYRDYFVIFYTSVKDDWHDSTSEAFVKSTYIPASTAYLSSASNWSTPKNSGHKASGGPSLHIDSSGNGVVNFSDIGGRTWLYTASCQFAYSGGSWDYTLSYVQRAHSSDAGFYSTGHTTSVTKDSSNWQMLWDRDNKYVSYAWKSSPIYQYGSDSFSYAYYLNDGPAVEYYSGWGDSYKWRRAWSED